MNELSIIIACPWSSKVLPEFMDSLANHLTSHPSDVEILIVTSTLNEAGDDLARYVGTHFPWMRIRLLQKTGTKNSIGSIIRFAIAFSTSKYVLLLSPYGDNDLTVINDMLGKVRRGAQVVQATRYTTDERIEGVSFRFRLYQYIYRLLARILLGIDSGDITFGYKIFDRTFVQALGITHNTHAIFPEINIKAILAGGNIEYVPSKVLTAHIGSKFRLLNDGPGYLWIMVRGFLHRIKLVNWF